MSISISLSLSIHTYAYIYTDYIRVCKVEAPSSPMAAARARRRG